MITQFARKTQRIRNVLAIMNDREERNWREIKAEMQKRYGMNVARATLYYYFDVLIDGGFMIMSKKLGESGLGRPRTFFKIVKNISIEMINNGQITC